MEPVAGSGGSSLELGHDCYAAIDLGSNSFHLVISRYRLGEFLVMERQRKVVRLAAGLDENNVLSTESADKALVCLAEFSQLLVSLPSENIRAVGTNALRRLHGKNEFLEQAERALGHSIEIIAGREEARLIYLGVSKWSVNRDESRMVIDIGGGSTEVIVGKGDATHIRESLEIGCVVLSKQYFVDGELNQQSFDDAILAAKLAIQPVVRQFQLHGWTRVIGCSGTMKSIELAMLEAGWSTDGIRKQGLQHLLAKAIDAGDVNRLVIPGVSRDRLPVFAGGLAILIALFDSFNIQEMAVSDIALREGVLYDLVGRSSVEDIRDVTVRAMLNRWGVDIDHGNQVQNTASLLYKQVVASWDLRDDLLQRVLAWSAQLHEVGLQISHDGYHKHGAYLLANADMAGFARRDQLLLAALVSGHRRKFPLSEFESLPSALVTPAKRIAILLRIAVLLHRGRGSNIKVNVVAHANGQRLELKFDERWIEDHPLTRADLKLEQVRLKAIGLKLIVR
jgi:exopolyphosphatase/guanosine-5'-triphosphate,3'-diphosphate pyrophosphatase